MEKFPELQKIITAALNQAALDGGMLLGRELAVKEVEGAAGTKQDYMARMEDASFIVGVRSQEEYNGTFFLLFTLRDAIGLGSLLLGVPLARVSEKKKLAIIDSDDVDAFSEFSNQVIGSFNSVFKSSLPKKVHLKLIDTQKFIPGNDEVTPDAPVPDGEYFIFRVQLEMPEQEFDRIDILIPSILAGSFDQQAATEGAADADAAPAEAEAEAEVEAADTGAVPEQKPVANGWTVLILEDNSTDRQFFQETLSVTEIKTIAADLDADLSGFLPDSTVNAVILGVTEADDHEFSICIKIRTMSPKGPVPVIMCAREWTRTGVLKALKYGATDIIIKPCTPDELRSKVLKLLKAA